MKTDKPKSKGRTPIVIDWDKVNKNLIAGCNGVEIAGLLGIHPDTLYMKCEKKYKMGFSAYAAQKRAHGDALLRRKGFDEAMGDNTVALIFHLKDRLGMQDRKTVNVTFDKVPKVSWIDDIEEPENEASDE